MGIWVSLHNSSLKSVVTVYVHVLLSKGISAAGRSRLVEVACDRSSLLAACVAEAVRLRAPGVAVRMAACDLDMPTGQDTTVSVKKVVISLPLLGTCTSPFPFLWQRLHARRILFYHELMIPLPTIVEWLALAFSSVQGACQQGEGCQS